MNGSLVDLVFGYDFFISYRWEDGRSYAVALEKKLKQSGYICFLDSKEYPIGANWRVAGQRALRKSGKLILVASPGVLLSDAVYGETEFFLKTVGRPVQAIDFGGTILNHPDHRLTTLIGGANNIWIEEPVTVLRTLEVKETCRRLTESFKLLRQDRWRSRVFGGTAAMLFGLACGLGYFAWQSEQRRLEAVENEAEARQLVAATDFRFAQEAIKRGEDSEAVAYLAHGLRQGPPTPRLQTRLLALLTERAWALPVSVTEYLGGFEGPSISPDGKRMLTHRDQDREVVVELLTGKNLFALTGVPDIRYSAFTPDGRFICTASPGQAAIWHASDGKLVKKFPIPDTPTSFDIAPDSSLVAIGTKAGQLVNFNLQQNVGLPLRVVGANSLRFLSFSRDSQRLITVDGEGTARLLEVSSGRVLVTLGENGRNRKVNRAKFTPDGSELVTASQDTLDVWGAEDGSLRVSATAQRINNFDTAASGAFLVAAHGLETREESAVPQLVGGIDPSLQLLTGSGQRWAPNLAGQLISAGRYPHRADVFGVALPPNQQHPGRFATASWDFTARIWPIREDLYGTEIPLFPTPRISLGEWEMSLPSPPLWHGAAVNSVTFTFDGSHLVTHSMDGKATVWTGRPGRVEARRHLLTAPSQQLALHKEKGRAAIVSEDGVLHWIDAETAQPAGRSIPESKPASIAWQQDGEALWAVNAVGQLSRIPWAGDASTAVALAGAGSVRAWRRDGSLLLRASESPEVTLIQPNQADKAERTLMLPSPCREAVFSPDGKRLLILCGAEQDQPGQLTLWDAASGSLLGKWATADAEGPLSFGGEWATRGLKAIELFDLLRPGTAARQLDFPDPASVCTLSDDGRRLAVCLSGIDVQQGHVRIFEPATLTLIARAAPVSAGVAAAFDPSSRRLATLSSMGEARCWDTESGESLVDPFGISVNGGGKNGFVEFTGSGEGMLRVSGSSVQAISLPSVLDLAESKQRDRLAAFAEAIAQCRIGKGSQPERILPGEALANRIALLNEATPKFTQPSLEGVFQWLLADPLKRPLAPFARHSVEDYWREKIDAASPLEFDALQGFVSDWPAIAEKLADRQMRVEQAKTPQQKSLEAYNLARFYSASGHLQQALDSFGDAIEFDPGNDDAVGEAAQVVLLMGNADDALNLIGEARQLRPQSDTLRRFEARLNFLAERYPRALELFETLDRERGAGTPRPLAGLAISNWAMNKQIEAMNLYTELVQSDAKYLDSSYVDALDFPEPIRRTLLGILNVYLLK